MTRLSLLDLSTEILISIAQQLCLHCSHGGLKAEEPRMLYEQESRIRQVALSQLSMTCKKFRDIAQPILFHLPTIDDQLPRFVETLVQRPGLARSIKQLRFEEMRQRDDNFSEDDGIRLAEKAGMEIDTDDFPWEDEDEQIRFLQLLILHLTPKLEHLSVEVSFNINIKEPLSKALPCLHTLEARHDDTEGGFDVSQVQGIMRSAPNLKRFEAIMMNEAGEVEEPVYSDSVTWVTLANSVVGGPDLEKVMRGFPKLEVFYYHSGDVTVTNFESVFTPIEMARALSIRRQTLKEININLSDWQPVEDLADYEAMSTLKTMEVLEKLMLDDTCVRASPSPIGKRLIDILPQCIRVFGLANAHRDLDQDILHLAEVATKEFPALEKVEIWNISDQRRGMFESAFAKHGIKFGANKESEFNSQ